VPARYFYRIPGSTSCVCFLALVCSVIPYEQMVGMEPDKSQELHHRVNSFFFSYKQIVNLLFYLIT
jgi:hypothetical protein